MDWYSGDVGSAVAKCKSEGDTLIVYIYGADEMSQTMDNIWTDSRVVEVFGRTRSVKLKLSVDSVGGKQFAQIYPVLMVPSTFFITSDGVPVESVVGVCTVEELVEKTENVFRTMEKPTSPAAAVSRPSASGESSGGAAATADAATVSTFSGALGAGAGELDSELVDSHEEDSTMSPEEKEAKVERARKLIAEKQKKRAEEEKEKARQAELERRKLGQDMNKLKEFKADMEAKETRDALHKEKEETRLARERVRQQIQKDREARSARYHKEKEEKEQVLKAKEQERLRKQAEQAAQLAAARSLKARLQFRLPDGSNVNHEFEADETLQSARDVVAAFPSNPFGTSFRLATIYPRRVFTPEESGQTFRELELVPTSALLVLPPTAQSSGGGSRAAGPSASTPGSETSSALETWGTWLLTLPLLLAGALWRLIQGLLPSGNPPSEQPRASASGQSSGPQRSSADNDGARNRRVGRLSDLRDGDDDQNTWNGNSTQQM